MEPFDVQAECLAQARDYGKLHGAAFQPHAAPIAGPDAVQRTFPTSSRKADGGSSRRGLILSRNSAAGTFSIERR